MQKNALKEYVFITLGVIPVAAALEFFFIPASLAAGGVAGIAILLESVLPAVPQSMLVLAMNIILFAIGFLLLGNRFGAKTIYSSLALSGAMWFIERFLSPHALTDDLFLAAMFGTLLSAVGMAVVFNQNASTGGTDILAKIISRFTSLNIGRSLLIVDSLIGILCITTFGMRTGLYAILCIIFGGTLIDRVIDGVNMSRSVVVISEKNEQILAFIIRELERTATIMRASGGYTGEARNLVYVLLSRREYIRLRQFIRETDPRAFLAVSETREVLGEGFRPLD